METATNTKARQPVNGVSRLVRRLERERRQWNRRQVDAVATDVAWRAGVAEGLRLAQIAIRKGV
ncbi:hypothetical protein [Pseudonocardia sp. MH-G8]|uniref:hypothetical protein n=1 Tax=Pseudonocardia sp. MH-G8 TaxID=1854588 RepID=UPI00117BB44E|nr:hypothetical protein [Pseudonocardia sp. MH-G8]